MQELRDICLERGSGSEMSVPWERLILKGASSCWWLGKGMFWDESIGSLFLLIIIISIEKLPKNTRQSLTPSLQPYHNQSYKKGLLSQPK